MSRTYWTGQCEPQPVGCRRLNPSQNGPPARNGTGCQASGSPRRRSPPGRKSRVAGGGGRRKASKKVQGGQTSHFHVSIYSCHIGSLGLT